MNSVLRGGKETGVEALALPWNPRGRGFSPGQGARPRGKARRVGQDISVLRKASGHISRGQARMWRLEHWGGGGLLGVLLGRPLSSVGYTVILGIQVVSAADILIRAQEKG